MITGPLLALAIVGAVTLIIGIAWYLSNPVSAGYPGSLFMLMGTIFIGIAWWNS